MEILTPRSFSNRTAVKYVPNDLPEMRVTTSPMTWVHVIGRVPG